MIADVVTVMLAGIGLFTVVCVLAGFLAAHLIVWPRTPVCACGQWPHDPDTGFVLPLIASGVLHEPVRCQPVREAL